MVEIRFTPTRVGTAQTRRRRPELHQVHPHASGDSLKRALRSFGEQGSPPREWGQLCPPGASVDVARFTPTRVGTAPPPHWELRSY